MFSVVWFVGTSAFLIAMIISLSVGVLQFDLLGRIVFVVVLALFFDSLFLLVGKWLNDDRYAWP